MKHVKTYGCIALLLLLNSYTLESMPDDNAHIADFFTIEDIDQLLDQVLNLNLLFHAVRANDIDEITRLLRDDQDDTINEQDNLGNTPLHYAVMQNNATIVRLLLEHGAGRSMSVVNNEGFMPRNLMQYNPAMTNVFNEFLNQRRD